MENFTGYKMVYKTLGNNKANEGTCLGYKKLFKRVYVHEIAHKKLGITHLIRAAHGASAWRN